MRVGLASSEVAQSLRTSKIAPSHSMKDHAYGCVVWRWEGKADSTVKPYDNLFI